MQPPHPLLYNTPIDDENEMGLNDDLDEEGDAIENDVALNRTTSQKRKKMELALMTVRQRLVWKSWGTCCMMEMRPPKITMVAIPFLSFTLLLLVLQKEVCINSVSQFKVI
jgi:hypothetical protein